MDVCSGEMRTLRFEWIHLAARIVRPAGRTALRLAVPHVLRLLRFDSRVQESGEALIDDLLGLGHDPIDQLLAGRDVVDEACDHAA